MPKKRILDRIENLLPEEQLQVTADFHNILSIKDKKLRAKKLKAFKKTLLK
jgi:hypothetical protein